MSVDLTSLFAGLSQGLSGAAEEDYLRQLSLEKEQRVNARQDRIRDEQQQFTVDKLLASLGLQTGGTLQDASVAVNEQKQKEELANQIANSMRNLQASVGTAAFDDILPSVQGIPNLGDDNALAIRALQAQHVEALQAKAHEVGGDALRLGLPPPQAAIFAEERGTKLPNSYKLLWSHQQNIKYQEELKLAAESAEDALEAALADVKSGSFTADDAIKIRKITNPDHQAQVKAADPRRRYFTNNEVQEYINRASELISMGSSITSEGGAEADFLGLGANSNIYAHINRGPDDVFGQLTDRQRINAAARQLIFNEQPERVKTLLELHNAVPLEDTRFEEIMRSKIVEDLNNVRQMWYEVDAGDLTPQVARKRTEEIISAYASEYQAFNLDPVGSALTYGVNPSVIGMLFKTFSDDTMGFQAAMSSRIEEGRYYKKPFGDVISESAESFLTAPSKLINSLISGDGN